MKRLVLFVLVAVAMAPAVRAAETSTGRRVEPGGQPNVVVPGDTIGPYYGASENELRGRKLARGLANVVLSVAEVPNQIFQEAYRTSPVTGAVVGAGKGVVKGLKRLVIGTWEVATFYTGLSNNYQPYIEPEVVFQEYVH